MMAAIGLIARWTTFAAILLSIGAVVFRLAVVARARVDGATRIAASRHAARLGAVAAAVIIPAALARLVVQTAQMRFPDDPWLGLARTLVASTSWGRTWTIQFASAALLMPAFSLARDGRASRWSVAALLVLVLSATPTLASHAMDAHTALALSVGADWVHVMAAGTWIGTLAVMFAVVGRDEHARGETMMCWLAAFSPIALGAVAVVASTGLLSSFFRLPAVNAIWSTTYGRTLLVKLAAVGVVVLLGWINWKRNTPAVVASGTSPIRAGMRAEVIAALVVLLVTALLVATSPLVESMRMP